MISVLRISLTLLIKHSVCCQSDPDFKDNDGINCAGYQQVSNRKCHIGNRKDYFSGGASTLKAEMLSTGTGVAFNLTICGKAGKLMYGTRLGAISR